MNSRVSFASLWKPLLSRRNWIQGKCLVSIYKKAWWQVKLWNDVVGTQLKNCKLRNLLNITNKLFSLMGNGKLFIKIGLKTKWQIMSFILFVVKTSYFCRLQQTLTSLARVCVRSEIQKPNTNIRAVLFLYDILHRVTRLGLLL